MASFFCTALDFVIPRAGPVPNTLFLAKCILENAFPKYITPHPKIEDPNTGLEKDN